MIISQMVEANSASEYVQIRIDHRDGGMLVLTVNGMIVQFPVNSDSSHLVHALKEAAEAL